jgi:hypothetical protein
MLLHSYSCVKRKPKLLTLEIHPSNVTSSGFRDIGYIHVDDLSNIGQNDTIFIDYRSVSSRKHVRNPVQWRICDLGICSC